MYEIRIQEVFSAAHSLREYGGKCENLHGHNWKVEVAVAGSDLDEMGVIMDFRKLREITREVLATLDHQYLNELEPFRKVNPSSEHLARYIYKQMEGRLQGESARVVRVSVWESDHSCATYVGELT